MSTLMTLKVLCLSLLPLSIGVLILVLLTHIFGCSATWNYFSNSALYSPNGNGLFFAHRSFGARVRRATSCVRRTLGVVTRCYYLHNVANGHSRKCFRTLYQFRIELRRRSTLRKSPWNYTNNLSGYLVSQMTVCSTHVVARERSSAQHRTLKYLRLESNKISISLLYAKTC